MKQRTLKHFTHTSCTNVVSPACNVLTGCRNIHWNNCDLLPYYNSDQVSIHFQAVLYNYVDFFQTILKLWLQEGNMFRCRFSSSSLEEKAECFCCKSVQIAAAVTLMVGNSDGARVSHIRWAVVVVNVTCTAGQLGLLLLKTVKRLTNTHNSDIEINSVSGSLQTSVRAISSDA